MGWTPQESQECADFDRDLRAVLADTSLNVALTEYAIGDE